MTNTKNTAQDNADNTPSVTFYGKMLTFSRLKLTTNDLTVIEQQLNSTLDNKNSKIPIIIDSDVELDLSKLTELLWAWGLQPIGVVKGELDQQATDMRLAIFPGDGKRMQRITPSAKKAASKPVIAASDKPATKPVASNPTNTPDKSKETATTKDAEAKIQQKDTASTSKTNQTSTKANDASKLKEASTTKASSPAPSHSTSSNALTQNSAPTEEYYPTPVEQITSLVYDQMLRSGQSVNHVGGDLILTNSVNDGAEAITDNSLHIYGKGSGRLVAGATGDKDAHIFCHRFNPSLVSVAGTYCLRDNIPTDVIDKPVQVSYQEGKGLVFRVMDL